MEDLKSDYIEAINDAEQKSKSKKVCSGCGTINEPTSKYCYKCGVKLQEQIQTTVLAVGNPAGFWIRLFAYVIDQLFLTLVMVIIGVIFLDVTIKEMVSELWGFTDITSWSIFWGSLLLEIVYFTYSVSKWGKTLGKVILGIKVVRMDGSPLSYSRSFFRYLSYYISFLPLGLGFFAIALSSKKRGFHDFICDTRVLRT